jgi:hypothetical protein
MDIGKVAGVYIEKTENTEYVAIAQLLVSGDLAALSDEQLAQLHRLISQLGGSEKKAISANEIGPSSASGDCGCGAGCGAGSRNSTGGKKRELVVITNRVELAATVYKEPRTISSTRMNRWITS